MDWWSWKEGVIPGFEIVQFSGTGAAHAENHSLSAVPGLMLLKNIDTASRSWVVYHHENTAAPETDFLLLNKVDATVDSIIAWNDVAPTSTQFTVGTSVSVNQSGTDNIIAYLFAGIEGFSKFGTYVGNGAADGTFVYCGFKPAFVLIKRTSSTGNWVVFDVTRYPNNVIFEGLAMDLDITDTATGDLDILSNGFKLREDQVATNASASDYVYIAFAEAPFQYSRAR